MALCSFLWHLLHLLPVRLVSLRLSLQLLVAEGAPKDLQRGSYYSHNLSAEAPRAWLSLWWIRRRSGLCDASLLPALVLRPQEPVGRDRARKGHLIGLRSFKTILKDEYKDIYG